MALILILSLDIAHCAYHAGEYRLAELELRRKLFYQHQITSQESLMLGVCLLKSGNNRMGIDILEELGYKGNFLIARYYLANGYYGGAEIELKDLMLSHPNDSIKEMLGVTLLLVGDMEAAKEFLPVEELNLKNPKLAALLSTFLPGLGELYGGKTKLAVIDCSMNSLTAYLLYKSIVNHQPMDTFIIIYFLTLRFYMGSRRNALLAAVEKNKQSIEDFLDKHKLKRWLQF